MTKTMGSLEEKVSAIWTTDSKRVQHSGFRRIYTQLLSCLGVGYLVLLLSAAAFAVNVHTDYHKNTNFSQYHTYYWKTVRSNEPLWRQRIQRAINKELQAKGWREVPSRGQVALSAVGAVHSQREYQTLDYGMGPGWWWGGLGDESTTTVQNVPVGTLVITMYDASSHRVIWRGTAVDTLSNRTSVNRRKLTMSVDKMFRNFPPRERRG